MQCEDTSIMDSGLAEDFQRLGARREVTMDELTEGNSEKHLLSLFIFFY